MLPINPANPAYIIYTSGSTGRPKGVVGLHEGAVNRLTWFGSDHAWDASKPVLSRASLNFIDGSTELLGGLVHGSEIILASIDETRDIQKLLRLIQTQNIDRVTLIPSLLGILISSAISGSLPSYGHWIVSGEQLPKSLLDEFKSSLPTAHLHNFYGSSEAAGDSVYIECLPDGLPPIGRPIWNTRLYVLDGYLRPVPAGVGGELYISG
ncbi:AMP-binding protein, partial [Rhizobium sp. VS19-DRK62.2]|uniref:AMP-binding protein n=1 Tax=unclassified Rhizobium TaxID=2613769 RepID=UPI001CC63A5B